MKHIKLFESFMSQGFTAVIVFMENKMAVGVFPNDEALRIYNKLSSVIPPNSDFLSSEVIEIPEGHDLVVVPLGGKGISTSNEEEMANYGDPVDDIVELGEDYDFGTEDQQMVFRVNPGVNGFVVLDSAGGTTLESADQIFKEAFGLLKNSGFSPEDSIQSGDTPFCWNFEDGWMVTLLDRVLASKMMDHLEGSESRLVDEPKYSNKKGVVFVATGIPTELSVEFEKENFDTSSFENLVNSQEDIENNLEGEFPGSCVFTLKRNHVIGYRWNGGQFCIPIEEYFEKYGEATM